VAAGLTVINTIDTRAQLLGVEGVLANQLDPYQFIKIASEKNRLNQLYDGNPPTGTDENLDDF